MVDDLLAGDPYDVLIGRGGIRPEKLDYGTGLGSYLDAIESNTLHSAKFLFIASP